MIQVVMDGSPLPDATWDLAVAFGLDGSAPTRHCHSGRVKAGAPGTPVVLEVPIEFAPGHHVLSLEARETSAGQTEARTIDGTWPDPRDAAATISPIVLLQPGQGTFVRGDSVRAQGALAIGEQGRVAIQLPTAVVSVVCRGAQVHGELRVERDLEGVAAVQFDPVTLSSTDTCAQLRDVVRPGTLGAGTFRYEMRVVTGTTELARKTRTFDAVGADRPPGS
jgi:hypothetical protein